MPLFKVGRVLATPAAIDALTKSGQVPFEFIARHVRGDFGDLSEEDRRLNDEAVKDGSRILSAYRLKSGVKLWLITEAEDEQGQRAASTILLPEEY